MNEALRVRVEVDEPFDLIRDSDDVVFVMGRVIGEESSRDELVIQVDEGATLGGRQIKTIIATPRYGGHTFSVLPDNNVIVNARAETDHNDIHFIGSIVAAAD